MDNKAQPTVLDKLVAQIRDARLNNKPLICIDTHEIQVIRDITVHPDNPVSALRKSAGPALWTLVSGENPTPESAGNISWYNQSNSGSGISGYPFDAPRIIVYYLGTPETTKINDYLKPLRDFVSGYISRIPSPQTHMLVYGDLSVLTPDLAGYAEVLNLEYPKFPEISNIIRNQVQSAHPGDQDPEKRILELSRDLRGFNYVEINNLVRYLLRLPQENTGVSYFWSDELCKKEINRQKQQVLKRNGGLLELIDTRRKIHLKGMKGLETWIDAKKDHIRDVNGYIRFVGASAPKGMLLIGTPGCGKSDAAKLLAQEWGLPLIKMDIGSLMGSLLGQSEKQMRDALRQIEACSPCVFWIDEIEKGLAGTSGASNDSSSLKRMFAYLLSWLADDHGENVCFAYITANSLKGLPPELFRTGRVDVRFSVSMPTQEECADIFIAQIERAEKRAQEEQKAETGRNSDWKVLKSDDGDEDRKALRATILNQIINGSANSLLNPGNGRKPLFVNGSDIYFLVNEAMSACLKKCKNASEKDRKPLENELPVSESEFILALQEIIGGKSPADSDDGTSAKRSSGFTSQGYGDTNLMQLAETELRTIRGSFTPCSAHPLFTSADYSEVEDNPEGHSRISGLRKVKIADNSERLPKNSYDRALYTALRERMEKFTLQPVSLDAQ